LTDKGSVGVKVPRVNANEDTVVLVKWLAETGAAVSRGDSICEIESSKAVIEVEAPRDGYLHYAIEEGTELEVGREMALIGLDPEPPAMLRDESQERPARQAGAAPRISEKAKRLADELGVPSESFVGMAVVREADVRRMAGSQTTERATAVPLTPIQRRVASAVTESLRTIPTSSVEIRVEAQPLLEKARELGGRYRLMVSPTALVIAGFARALKGSQRFNARFESDALRPSPTVNVNVLMDAQGELVNPVIHAADTKEVDAIARELGDLQKRAASKGLHSADLAGGTVTVTSLFGTGASNLSPIVYPGQTAILGIGDMDEAVAPPTMTWVLAFDHRAANALAAARVLTRTLEEVRAL